MKSCANCGNSFLAGLTFCPFCLAPQAREKKVGHFVVIYRPPTESFAYLAKGLVESEGVTTVLHSYQIAMYDDVGVMMEGVWGELLVPKEQLERALLPFRGLLFNEKPEENSNDSS